MEHVRNLSFVAPFCFRKCLELYFVEKRKSVLSIMGSTGPYGSYPTVIAWLNIYAGEVLVCPSCNIITYFDNSQVVGKSWNVKVDNKVKQSVITMNLHISPTVFPRLLGWIESLSPLHIGMRCLTNPLFFLGIYPHSNYYCIMRNESNEVHVLWYQLQND